MQVLVGAKLFDGRRFRESAALVIEGERIAAVVPHREAPRRGRRDLGGGVLSPGLIDIQVNGGGGVLFNDDPTPQGIRAIQSAHRRFGTTGLLPTVITDAPKVLKDALSAQREAIPGVIGVHVEGPFIDVRRKGAHPEAFIRPLDDEAVGELIAAKAGAMIVTLAPASATPALIKTLVESGIVVSVGHAEATDAEALACFDAGAKAVTHLFNAMSQLQGRAPGLVGAALSDSRIVCGLIADGHHVARTAVRAAVAAKGPEGLALISDAMPPAAGGPPSFRLQGREVALKNGRLELADGTIGGAAITLVEAVRWIVNEAKVPLADALSMATLTPARLIGQGRLRGRLAKGYVADLVHLSDSLEAKETWIGGVAAPSST